MSRVTKGRGRGGIGRKRTSTTPMKAADQLFSKLIRSRGSCAALGEGYGPCAGPLQCAHGFSRSYHATRYDERNAWALCLGHHKMFTHRPLQWDEFMRWELGQARYVELRKKALTGGKTDYKTLLADLRERTEQL